MSIATELQNYNDGLLDAYTAVNTKGGTVPEAKNLDNLDTAIASIPAGGGGGDEEKDIRFYDYDGTLIEAWTLAELQEKTELPANPTHTGLTSLGWNWTLAQLKSENARMTVGQMYEPTDGGLHIFLTVYPEHLSLNLGLVINGTVSINWGDNSTVETATSTGARVNTPHTFPAAGNYEIIVTAESENIFSLQGDSTGPYLITEPTNAATSASQLYRAGIYELWVSHNCTVGSRGIYNLAAEKIIFNSTLITSTARFVENCYNLKAFVLPSSSTTTGTHFMGGNMNCFCLSLPYGLTSIGTESFNSSSFDFEINIPSSVTSIANGCFSVLSKFAHKIVIPSNVASIGNVFMVNNSNFHELEVNTSAIPATGLTSNPTYLTFINGIILTGSQASTWITALPNVYADNNARNLINGTI